MILNQISKYINDVVSVSYNDKTKRESDRKFWDYILNIFISHIPSSKILTIIEKSTIFIF